MTETGTGRSGTVCHLRAGSWPPYLANRPTISQRSTPLIQLRIRPCGVGRSPPMQLTSFTRLLSAHGHAEVAEHG